MSSEISTNSSFLSYFFCLMVIMLSLLRVVMDSLNVITVLFFSSVLALDLNTISCDSLSLKLLSPRMTVSSVYMPTMSSGPLSVTRRHGSYVNVIIPSFSL